MVVGLLMEEMSVSLVLELEMVVNQLMEEEVLEEDHYP